MDSIAQRYRRAVKARDNFLTDQAALKCFYPSTRSLDPPAGENPRGAMEACPPRLRRHLRQPVPGPRNQPTEPPRNIVGETDRYQSGQDPTMDSCRILDSTLCAPSLV